MSIRNFFKNIICYFLCGYEIEFRLKDPDTQMKVDKQMISAKIKTVDKVEDLDEIWSMYNAFETNYGNHKDIIKTLAEFRQNIKDRRLSILFNQSKVQ